MDWSSTDASEKYACRAVCKSECPVRQQCLQFALDNKFIHGIWGGVDDYEIRRALSVSSMGAPSERDRPPRCPYCLSRKIDIATTKTRKGYRTVCTQCNLEWDMACIPTKLRKK